MTTNTMKKLLDPTVLIMIEAGFLTEDLRITKELGYYLEHLNFVDKKAQVVARAKEIIAERKAK